jgi:ribulose 1,5-bisphosphate synthetase/thiazole synthase
MNSLFGQQGSWKGTSKITMMAVFEEQKTVLQPTQIGVRIQGRTLLVKNSSYEYRSTYLVACTSAISIAKMT